MKKLFLLFSASTFLMIASVVSVQAQNDTLPPSAKTDSMPPTTQTVTNAQPTSDIVDLTMNSNDISKLSELIKTSGMTERFKAGGPYTFFAPNNAAFERMPVNDMNRLMKNKTEMNKLLTRHVVGGNWNAALLMTAIKQNNGSVQLPTMGGGKLIASVEDGKIKLADENGNSFYVVNADIAATNGMIHVIDGVVVQPVQESVTKKQ